MSSQDTSAVCTSRQRRSVFLLSKALPIITSCLLALIVTSCTPMKVQLDETGYVIGQDNYAFAIYTEDGNLLTHPLEQFRQRQNAQPDRPFTDVYVISHGWNFTIPEAIANYHSYIEILDQQMKHQAFGTEFRPFFIFVVWNSVTRPLTDALRAILPYQFDAPLGLITNPIDKSIFFLPSVWKQAINAYTIALGQDLPDESPPRYRSLSSLGKSTPDCLDDDQSTACYGIEEKAMGSNYPVSALLHGLLREKEKSPQPPGIHVIGHSFGAKLAALSSMEAIRQWKLEHFSREVGLTPLDSLLLISPAMNPREFAYTVGLLADDKEPRRLPPNANAEQLLRSIPRKGIIYSNYDYPNGLYFDISQIVLNNSEMQYGHSLMYIMRQHLKQIQQRTESDPIESRFSWALYRAVMFPGIMGMHVVYAIVGWTGTKVFNVPSDFLYHLGHNYSFQETSSPLFKATRYAFNALHFFIPLDRLIWPGQPADQLGLFRPTKPALGRTGLNKAVNGRSKWWNVHPVENFIDNTTDVNPATFCVLARTIYNKSSDLPPDAPALKHTRIYSFDASMVFDGGQFSPSGSHGDVGSHDLVECDPESKAPAIQKREYSANFIFNFTKILPLSNETASKP